MPVRPEARATNSSSAMTHASLMRASMECSTVRGSATKELQCGDMQSCVQHDEFAAGLWG